MRLIPLDVGRVDMARWIIDRGADGVFDLPITSWLIDHPAGLVLFDTGMHPGLQTDTTRLGASSSFLTIDYDPGQEISARLEERGIRPSDVSVVVLSHLHFDHAGGCAQLPEARIVIDRAEWAAGHDPAAIDQGIYDPADYDHGHTIEEVEDGHDLFGDGRLICVATPGHTAGHQSLRIELDSGPVVLTGDCVYFQRMLDEMHVPRFGHDTDMQRTSMAHLARMRDDGCRLLSATTANSSMIFPWPG